VIEIHSSEDYNFIFITT